MVYSLDNRNQEPLDIGGSFLYLYEESTVLLPFMTYMLLMRQLVGVHTLIIKRLEVLSMKNKNFGNTEYFNTIVTQETEDSDLLLARKKIILPERKIIVEKPEGLSLLQYQPDTDGEFGRTSTGIILSR